MISITYWNKDGEITQESKCESLGDFMGAYLDMITTVNEGGFCLLENGNKALLVESAKQLLPAAKTYGEFTNSQQNVAE